MKRRYVVASKEKKGPKKERTNDRNIKDLVWDPFIASMSEYPTARCTASNSRLHRIALLNSNFFTCIVACTSCDTLFGILLWPATVIAHTHPLCQTLLIILSQRIFSIFFFDDCICLRMRFTPNNIIQNANFTVQWQAIIWQNICTLAKFVNYIKLLSNPRSNITFLNDFNKNFMMYTDVTNLKRSHLSKRNKKLFERYNTIFFNNFYKKIQFRMTLILLFSIYITLCNITLREI